MDYYIYIFVYILLYTQPGTDTREPGIQGTRNWNYPKRIEPKGVQDFFPAYFSGPSQKRIALRPCFFFPSSPFYQLLTRTAFNNGMHEQNRCKSRIKKDFCWWCCCCCFRRFLPHLALGSARKEITMCKNRSGMGRNHRIRYCVGRGKKKRPPPKYKFADIKGEIQTLIQAY